MPILRESFLREGFVTIRGLVSTDTLATTLRGVARMVSQLSSFAGSNFDAQEVAKGAVDSQQLNSMLDWAQREGISARAFLFDVFPQTNLMQSVVNSCEVVSAMRDVLGMESGIPLIGVNPNFRIDEPGAEWVHRLPWHQDYPYKNPFAFAGDSAVLWIPILPCPLQLGPPELIPGSHKWGAVSTTEVDLGEGRKHWYVPEEELERHSIDPVQVDLDAGDAIIFDTYLVHRSGINRSSTCRRFSIQCRYTAASHERLLAKYVRPERTAAH